MVGRRTHFTELDMCSIGGISKKNYKGFPYKINPQKFKGNSVLKKETKKNDRKKDKKIERNKERKKGKKRPRRSAL